jgi:hypothetical protein
MFLTVVHVLMNTVFHGHGIEPLDLQSISVMQSIGKSKMCIQLFLIYFLICVRFLSTAIEQECNIYGACFRVCGKMGTKNYTLILIACFVTSYRAFGHDRTHFHFARTQLPSHAHAMQLPFRGLPVRVSVWQLVV